MTSTTPDPQDLLDGFVSFPADVADRYRAAGYWRGEPLGELLRTAARTWPQRTAVHTGTGSLDYAELDRRADRMAAGLLAAGIESGDRVVVQLPNVSEFAEVLFGLLRAGIVPVLALPAHRQAEIEHLTRLAGAVGYIVADRVGDFDYRDLATAVAERVPSLRQIFVLGDPGPHTELSSIPCEGDSLPEIDASGIALMLVSGGTTGLPKLIARTHDDYAYNARASAELCRLTSDDVYLAALPAAHNFPLSCPGILGTVSAGASIVMLSDASPENAFATIEQFRVTVTAVVPPLAQLWCAAVEWEEADLSSLRLLQVGGAKLAEVNARTVTPALGAKLQQVFGMAEGLINYTRLDDPDDLICVSQGRPLSPADEVRVVDSAGNDVPLGEEGELLTRGPYTIRGYYRAPEHNSRGFTPDGFYRSGDLVRLLPSGHLIVSGRIKDVINRGGENISCDELEEHLLAHPVIRQAAAVGLPDPALGEKVCAVLVIEGELPSLAEIKNFLTERGLATYKLPDILQRTDTLPFTAVGKIDKKVLRATYETGGSAPSAAAS